MMNSIFLDPTIWWIAGGIFLMRTANMTVDTVRTLTVIRGMRLISFILGVFEGLLFILALRQMVSGMNNILYILAYSIGFAAGGWLGMIIEDRLAFGFIHITIVSTGHGDKIARKLRKYGHAVTSVQAQGRDGAVTILESTAQRKHLNELRNIICKNDKNAFITTRDVQPVHRGYYHD